MKQDSVMVDIPMCAYNHERFIAKAIEGVLMQQTNFNYRLIIGEDCSTDKTREIIEHFREQYPDKIVAFFRERNYGAYENSKLLFSECQAKYIALCDGDDYWIDPLKLQKQFDFLESHPDFTLCAGNSKVIYDDQRDRVEYFRPDWSDCALEVLRIEDQIKYEVTYQTSSVAFRNILDFSAVYHIPLSSDIVIFTMLAEKGDLCFMNEVFSCYRVHSGGISNSTMSFRQVQDKYVLKIRLYNYLNEFFKYRYAKLYDRNIRFYNEQLVKHFIRGREIGLLFNHVFRNATGNSVLSSFISVLFSKSRKKLVANRQSA